MKYQEQECYWCARQRRTTCCQAYTVRDGDLLVCLTCKTEAEIECDCEDAKEHRASLARDDDGGPYGGDGPDD